MQCIFAELAAQLNKSISFTKWACFQISGSTCFLLIGISTQGFSHAGLLQSLVCGIYNYNDVIMSAIASKITSVSIVYSTICSGADRRKHQSSASLAFVRGIHRSPVNSPHKGPVTRKMFPFDDVIMSLCQIICDIDKYPCLPQQLQSLLKFALWSSVSD